jgi:hypothetical protein
MNADVTLSVFAVIIVFILLAVSAGWIATKPTLAAWIIFGLILLDSAKLPLVINYGILLYPEDLFFIILGFACIIRFSLYVNSRAVPIAWWIIGAVQSILFVWGFKIFGSSAGVDYRDHFYLWVTVLYFCSIKWTDAMINDVANAWVIGSLGICFIVYYRWIGSAIDPAYAQKIMDLDTTGVRFRVVGSGAALVVAVGFLIILFKKMVSRKSSLYMLIILPMMFLTVLILQHRSVWVSLIIGTACLFWALQQMKRGFKTAIGIALIVAPLSIFSMVSGDGNPVLSSVGNSASQAVSVKEGTMVSRVINWNELITKWASSKNAVTFLIGSPYGGGYNPVESEDGKLTFDMVPHNHLVHILYRGGLIGLIATIYMFYRLWIGGINGMKLANRPWAPFFLSIFATFYSFYIPYWATYSNGVIIGIAISYLGIARANRVRIFRASGEQSYLNSKNY